jgi:CheY-like chemotaxis protein
MMSRLPPRVLIADDDDATRAAERTVLEYAGCIVHEVSCGPDALALTLADHPTVLLLDLVLPGIDGLQLARMLRADPSVSSLRVLALSASGGAEERVNALLAGCDAFLAKPLSPFELLAAMHDLLAGTLDFDPLRRAVKKVALCGAPHRTRP